MNILYTTLSSDNKILNMILIYCIIRDPHLYRFVIHATADESVYLPQLDASTIHAPPRSRVPISRFEPLTSLIRGVSASCGSPSQR
jgi:hypothetical protein